MVPTQAVCSHNELANLIERQIVQRTWGRIHRLQVEVADQEVIVHGHTRTYFSKQLALEAVREIVDDCVEVQLNIQVIPTSSISLTSPANRPGRSAAG